MHDQPIPVTEQGYKMYQEKLHRLKTTDRSAVAERIRQAKEFGDISDNAEYETAKSDQAFIEGEIIQLERLLLRAKIIDRNELSNDEVSIGSTVQLKDESTKEVFTLTLVGTNEADIEKGRISNESPVGGAILDQKLNAKVEVKTPKGLAKFKIIKIETTI